MPEARGLQEASREQAFGCEDEARVALATAASALSAVPASPLAPGRATLSLRWRRSGAEGLLAASILPGRPPQDAEDVRWLPLLERAPGAEAGRDAGTTADIIAGASADSTDVDTDADTDADIDAGTNAMRLHRTLYRHRADVSAILIARPVFGTTLACLPRVRAAGIPEFHPDVTAAAGGTIRCASPASGSPRSPSSPRSPLHGDPVLEALQDRRACLLGGQGLLTVGHTLPSVLARAAEIESLAQIYLQVLQSTDKAAEPAKSATVTSSAGAANAATARVAAEEGR